MKKDTSNPYHVLFLLFFALFAILVIFPFLYTHTYSLINHWDSSIYIRYATDNKYSENIFFSSEINENTQIIDQLSVAIDELKNVSRIQEFASLIHEHSDEVKMIISNNELYQQHLSANESSIEDLLLWAKQMGTLDDKILLSSLYLTFLIISFCMVKIFKFRIMFYLLAGIVYTTAALSIFSDGISDYLFVIFQSLVDIVSSSNYTYADIDLNVMILHQAFKESTLTFIIFDTPIQIIAAERIEKKKQAFQNIFTTLERQCNMLHQIEDTDNFRILRTTIPTRFAIKTLKKLKRKNMFYPKFTQKEKNQKEQLIMQYVKLIEKLNLISTRNHKSFSTEEYVKHSRQIQFLLETNHLL